jgi:hypothetical protein
MSPYCQHIRPKRRLSLVGNQIRRAALVTVFVWSVILALTVDMRSQAPVLPERQLAREAFGANAP